MPSANNEGMNAPRRHQRQRRRQRQRQHRSDNVAGRAGDGFPCSPPREHGVPPRRIEPQSLVRTTSSITQSLTSDHMLHQPHRQSQHPPQLHAPFTIHEPYHPEWHGPWDDGQLEDTYDSVQPLPPLLPSHRHLPPYYTPPVTHTNRPRPRDLRRQYHQQCKVRTFERSPHLQQALQRIEARRMMDSQQHQNEVIDEIPEEEEEEEYGRDARQSSDTATLDSDDVQQLTEMFSKYEGVLEKLVRSNGKRKVKANRNTNSDYVPYRSRTAHQSTQHIDDLDAVLDTDNDDDDDDDRDQYPLNRFLLNPKLLPVLEAHRTPQSDIALAPNQAGLYHDSDRGGSDDHHLHTCHVDMVASRHAEHVSRNYHNNEKDHQTKGYDDDSSSSSNHVRGPYRHSLHRATHETNLTPCTPTITALAQREDDSRQNSQVEQHPAFPNRPATVPIDVTDLSKPLNEEASAETDFLLNRLRKTARGVSTREPHKGAGDAPERTAADPDAPVRTYRQNDFVVKTAKSSVALVRAKTATQGQRSDPPSANDAVAQTVVQSRTSAENTSLPFEPRRRDDLSQAAPNGTLPPVDLQVSTKRAQSVGRFGETSDCSSGPNAPGTDASLQPNKISEVSNLSNRAAQKTPARLLQLLDSRFQKSIDDAAHQRQSGSPSRRNLAAHNPTSPPSPTKLEKVTANPYAFPLVRRKLVMQQTSNPQQSVTSYRSTISPLQKNPAAYRSSDSSDDRTRLPRRNFLPVSPVVRKDDVASKQPDNASVTSSHESEKAQKLAEKVDKVYHFSQNLKSTNERLVGDMANLRHLFQRQTGTVEDKFIGALRQSKANHQPEVINVHQFDTEDSLALVHVHEQEQPSMPQQEQEKEHTIAASHFHFNSPVSSPSGIIHLEDHDIPYDDASDDFGAVLLGETSPMAGREIQGISQSVSNLSIRGVEDHGRVIHVGEDGDIDSPVHIDSDVIPIESSARDIVERIPQRSPLSRYSMATMEPIEEKAAYDDVIHVDDDDIDSHENRQDTDDGKHVDRGDGDRCDQVNDSQKESTLDFPVAAATDVELYDVLVGSQDNPIKSYDSNGSNDDGQHNVQAKPLSAADGNSQRAVVAPASTTVEQTHSKPSVKPPVPRTRRASKAKPEPSKPIIRQAKPIGLDHRAASSLPAGREYPVDMRHLRHTHSLFESDSSTASSVNDTAETTRKPHHLPSLPMKSKPRKNRSRDRLKKTKSASSTAKGLPSVANDGAPSQLIVRSSFVPMQTQQAGTIQAVGDGITSSGSKVRSGPNKMNKRVRWKQNESKIILQAHCGALPCHVEGI